MSGESWKKHPVPKALRALYLRLPLPLRYHIYGRWKTPPTNEYISRKGKARIESELRTLLSKGSHPSIWFVPSDTWYSTIFQRPQQMARALAEVGCSVIYHEPWFPNLNILQNSGLRERRFTGLKKLARNLHLLRYPDHELRDLLTRLSPDALIFFWPWHAPHVPPDTKIVTVYELIDDHALLGDLAQKWESTHHMWIDRADVVVATADDLAAQLRPLRPDTLLLPNAVRKEDWHHTALPVPPDMIEIANNKGPIVGYYGAIAEWFNWELWEEAARLKPEWSFVLIGPAYDGDTEGLKRRVARFSNMHYLGPKLYSELPAYLSLFSVASIPFVLNSITHACSPIKLFEFMSAGKPIVATPMREIVKYRSVLTASTAEEFVARVSEALKMANDESYQQLLKAESDANTWRSRAKLLRDAIIARQGEAR